MKVVELKLVRATWNWSLFRRVVQILEAWKPLISRAQQERSTHNHPNQPTDESTHRHQPLHTTTQRSIPHSESHNSLNGSASQSASDLPTLRVRFPLFPPVVSLTSFVRSRGPAALFDLPVKEIEKVAAIKGWILLQRSKVTTAFYFICHLRGSNV